MILCSVFIVVFRGSVIIAKEMRFPPIGRRLVAICVYLFLLSIVFRWKGLVQVGGCTYSRGLARRNKLKLSGTYTYQRIGRRKR